MLSKIKSFFSYQFEGKSKKEIRKEQLLALAAGVLMGVSFPPIPLFLLAFVALVPLLVVWEKRAGLAALNRVTYLFGLGFTLVTLYWVGSWTKQADPFLMISGAALIFFNPLLFLIPSTLFYFARKHLKINYTFLLVPLFWVFYEYIYTITDLRFPWIILGHGQAEFQSFIQIADTIGAMGISMLVVLTNVLFYLAYKSEKDIRTRFMTAGVLIIALPVIYGGIKLSNYKPAGKSVKVGIVQPNFNPWKKWEAGNLAEQIQQYKELSQKAFNENAKLILWPETALPVYLRNGYILERTQIRSFLAENDAGLLMGIPDLFFYKNKEEAPVDAKETRDGKRYYTSHNSLWGLIPEKNSIQAYQKVKLVPFGEFTPFANSLPFLKDFIKWGVGIGNWNAGTEIKLLEFPKRFIQNNNDKQLKVGGIICIESIFQEFVSGFVKKGADFIAVVTNDSWYGNSSGPRQHKAIGILRAVENKRSVVRCANGGISCIISPVGKVEVETKMFTEDVLVDDVSIEEELTFFTRFPNILSYLSVLVSLSIMVLAVIKRKSLRLNK